MPRRVLIRLSRAAGAASLILAARPTATVAQSAPPAEATADSLPATYRGRESAMSTRRFAMLWTATPGAFRRTWDSAHTADQRALAAVAGVSAAVRAREEMRLRFRHAWGRTAWPFFHWRETDAPTVRPDPALRALVRTLPLADPRWWTLTEHGALVGALVHEDARQRLARGGAARRGDVQWLRAEFAATRALFADRALQRRVTTRLITTHLDENDARGIDSVRGRWLALAPGADAVQRVDSMIAAAVALRAGHTIEVYRTVDGVAMELHLLRPTGGDTTGARPAMLWFHGGSATTGSWSHSPGVVSALRANGVMVVAVEFRTGARFDTSPIEQLEDAAAAFAYVRDHAARLAVDAQRIGVAGFSSGALLAATLATRGVAPERPAPAPSQRRYPAALVAMGTCVAPAGAQEDGYFRKVAGRYGSPADYSPTDLVAPGQPPMLLVHATKDEYCAYDAVEQFVARVRAAGNSVTLSSVPDATHFFGFYHRPGQAQMRRAIGDALVAWGWSR